MLPQPVLPDAWQQSPVRHHSSTGLGSKARFVDPSTTLTRNESATSTSSSSPSTITRRRSVSSGRSIRSSSSRRDLTRTTSTLSSFSQKAAAKGRSITQKLFRSSRQDGVESPVEDMGMGVGSLAARQDEGVNGAVAADGDEQGRSGGERRVWRVPNSEGYSFDTQR
ncbi:hypothetical protein K431DRAFT_301506 [Polychaeton citri CBS 116435]|uniref:Uncharacterized protein n=1 Tax=Polychaeton citri CBS 116435 TaxID=1314669 RepID=A0A9P4USB5_9PEZI|nr:hypothetical protein K431DRAFT_301506 [Polychaeton citri CBS 116435]